MNTKFRTGDYIRYSVSGVCLIDDICEMDIFGDGNRKEFYVLKPESKRASTIYVPLDNDVLVAKFEDIVSENEINCLIEGVIHNSIEWIEDKKRRSEVFKSIVKTCDRQELLSLVKCMYHRREYLIEIGKNLSSADEMVLKQAEDIIANEFSFALNIECDKLKEYALNILNK